MRVSTMPMQGVLANAIQSNLEKVASLQKQIATAKKVNSYADLGPEAVRTVATRTVAQREAAYSAAAQRTGATLAIYDANLNSLHDVAARFRDTLLAAVGTGNGEAIRPDLEALFGQARASLNAREGGRLLFAGTATEREPFTAASLDDLAVMASADEALANDEGRASVRVSDGMTLTYGLHADEAGRGIIEAMRRIAAADPSRGRLSDADMGVLTDALSTLNEGLDGLRGVQALNGRRQGDVEAAERAADDRNILFTKIVSDVEDADYAEVASRLIAAQTALEASYSLFAQLRELSLVNFLR